MGVSNEVLRKTLLEYCQDETAGTCLEVDPDEWDISDGPNSCSCSYEPTGFFGEIFLLKDIVKHLSYLKNFYSFRHYHNYKKINDMSPSEKLDCVLDFSAQSSSSPFGTGSDQEWNYEVVTLGGEKYFMTYCYMGS